jgi:hypothetical protein
MDFIGSWESALILFSAQLILSWVRAVNILHITKRSLWKGLASTNVLAGAYLLTAALGIRSLYELDPVPLVGYLAGASVGYYLAIRRNSGEFNEEV